MDLLIGVLVVVGIAAVAAWRWLNTDEPYSYEEKPLKIPRSPKKKNSDPVKDAIYNPKEFRKPRN